MEALADDFIWVVSLSRPTSVVWRQTLVRSTYKYQQYRSEPTSLILALTSKKQDKPSEITEKIQSS